MQKFGIVSSVKTYIFAWKIHSWVYRNQTEAEYNRFEDNSMEFWDGYTSLIQTLDGFVEPKTEKEACGLFTNEEIAKKYYFWWKEKKRDVEELLDNVLLTLNLTGA